MCILTNKDKHKEMLNMFKTNMENTINEQQNNTTPTYLEYICNKDIENTQLIDKNKLLLVIIQSVAKLTDNQKDQWNDPFANSVIAKTICKDPWGRLVR